ncbi:MAG TPA: hypothetical protein VGN39_03400 [Terriglobales bacterium]|jgi:hypothetical protein|nr:hypothetical protein [Terriglobales bacterium]
MSLRNGVSMAILSCLILLLGTVVNSAQAGEDPAPASRFDGPAELPRQYVQSSLRFTPASGRVINIRESKDLQKAIDGAKCGDTLKLEAGKTFRGLFRLPAKPCDDSHWIIIRTGASDESLPPEGTRISPCYAGVTSLPGRPDFHCASAQNVMSRIEFDGDGDSGPILFLSHANHYRLIGLEVTRAKPELHMRNLIQPKDPEDTADHLVFDRLWLHGTPQDETKGGIHLSGTTFVAIVDSYFSDFHCIARKGSCTDAQAINGGGGDAPGGPYKIVNNFLEASGECILFGGAPGTTTPADIEIRGNHLFKPLIWKPGSADFVGGYTGDPYIVKNNFELKNAQRVLFEGNLVENCWGGFTQKGFSIVLTPANQGGHCPECRVTDVTIRYNLIRHVGGALNIANVAGSQNSPSADGERYSIHDVLVDDIDGEKYNGTGLFALIISVAPSLKIVHLDHVTAFPQRAVLSVLNQGPKIEDFTISNSIFGAGERQMIGAGGGPANCAQPRDDPDSLLKNCFSNAIFTNNLIIGGGVWPRGNISLKNARDAGLRDFKEGHGGDYHLCREKGDGADCNKPSPALAKGSDGKNIGADVEGIEKAIAGVV